MFDYITALEVIKKAFLMEREEQFKKEVSRSDFRGVAFYGWVSSDGVFTVSLLYADHRYHQEVSSDFKTGELITAMGLISSKVLKREALELKERFRKNPEVLRKACTTIMELKTSLKPRYTPDFHLGQIWAEYAKEWLTSHNIGYGGSLLHACIEACLEDQEPVLSLEELKKLVPTYSYQGTPFRIRSTSHTPVQIYLHYASRLSVVGRTVELKAPITKTVVEDAIKAVVAKEIYK